MKLLSAAQFREWDAFTIIQEPISSIELMERAAFMCVEYICRTYTVSQPIRIFCAKGNNGGDGLAIARLLIGRDFQVSIYILEQGKIGTNDFQSNLNRLKAFTKKIYFIESKAELPNISKQELIIDALYGTGLNAPLEKLSKDAVEFINASGAEIISIDIPSGLFIDQSSIGNTIIKANTTLTFQALKLCFLAAENAVYFGTVHVLNIQLQQDFLKGLPTTYSLIEKINIKSLIKKRNEFEHKGKFGHALLIAGSDGKMGAAIIAARAAMRSGIGMLTVSVPAHKDAEMHNALPEAMVLNRALLPIDFEKFTTIGIGPGLGTEVNAQKIVKIVIENFKKPFLLDADALNILSKNSDWLLNLPPDSILTPHPKEFDRLFGASENEFERWQKAIHFSNTYQIVILVKGHHTLIASKGKAWFNSTGNVGLAKAGSGDCLSGIITSLLAQGYASAVAAILGVYIHGLAADLALEFQSAESMLATDTIERIGEAFKNIIESEI